MSNTLNQVEEISAINPLAGTVTGSSLVRLIFGESRSAASRSVRSVSLRNWIVLIALCSAAVMIYVHIWAQAPLTIPDTETYTEVMADLSQHHFALSQLHARTPGLPLFFLIAGTGRTFLRLALLFHVIGVAALAIVLFRLSVKPLVVWAFTLLALLPLFVQNTAFLGTEAITGSFLAIGFAALCLFIMDRRWVYCGLASFFFAWAGFTRPTNIITPFLLAFLLLIFFGKKFIKPALALVLLTGLLVGSYMTYNFVKFHYIGLTYATSFYLTSINVDLYSDIENPIAREELLKGRNDMYAEGMDEQDAIYRARVPLEKRLGLADNFQLSKFLMKMNIQLIVHHPQVYLESVARAATTYWYPGVTKLISGSPVRKLIWDFAGDLLSVAFWMQVIMMAGMSVGLRVLTKNFVLMGDRTLPYLMALGVIFQTEFITCTVIGEGLARYRSVTDLLILFSIVLVTDWVLSVRSASSASQSAFGLEVLSPKTAAS